MASLTKNQIDNTSLNNQMESLRFASNEEVEYEVLLAHDNGNTEFIHRVEKSGKRSI